MEHEGNDGDAVVNEHATTTCRAIELLQRPLDLEVSTIKSIVITSNSRTARGVAQSMKDSINFTITFTNRVKKLGAGNATGDQRNTKVLKARTKNVHTKTRAAQRLRESGANTAAWTAVAGVSSLVCSADTIGVATTMLTSM